MTQRNSSRRRGNTLIEFTLIGIPLIFVLISTFEMARGMWTYHTLAFAVREGTRYAIVKGEGCQRPGNTCSVTVADVARRIRAAGVGLDPAELQVQLDSPNGTVPCQPLSACFTNTTIWPPAHANTVGVDIGIRGTYPFRSAIAMFWPGAGAGMTFGAYNLPASSREAIQF